MDEQLKTTTSITITHSVPRTAHDCTKGKKNTYKNEKDRKIIYTTKQEAVITHCVQRGSGDTCEGETIVK